MTVEFALSRIAKLRNESCYSRKGLKDLSPNNKEYNVHEMCEAFNWALLK